MTRQRVSSGAATPLEARPQAPWMGATGLLMLALGLVGFNASFGVFAERWPWEVLQDGAVDLHPRSILGAWLLAGLWAALLGFTRARRARAVGAAWLASLLLLEIARGGGGDLLAGSAHDLDAGDLLRLLPLAALGAGLLLAREGSSRGRGRLLAFAGALLFLWGLVSVRFGGSTHLAGYVEDVGLLFQDLSRDFAGRPHHLWYDLLPDTLLLLATLAGLGAGLGLAARRWLATAFVLLLVGVLAPVVAHAVLDEGDVLARIVRQVVAANLLPWLLATFAAADLGFLHGGHLHGGHLHGDAR